MVATWVCRSCPPSVRGALTEYNLAARATSSTIHKAVRLFMRSRLLHYPPHERRKIFRGRKISKGIIKKSERQLESHGKSCVRKCQPAASDFLKPLFY